MACQLAGFVHKEPEVCFAVAVGVLLLLIESLTNEVAPKLHPTVAVLVFLLADDLPVLIVAHDIHAAVLV